MKRTILKFLFAILISANAFAWSINIPNVHIQASGNNKYEAQVKANKYGIRRCVMLILDRIQNNKTTHSQQNALATYLTSEKVEVDIKRIKFTDLKNICKITNIENAKIMASFYEANANYSCDSDSLINTLEKYNYTSNLSSFFNVLVIPVFKEKGKYIPWGNKNSWYKNWEDYKDELALHKALLAKPTSEINSDNILNLSYQNISSIYPMELFGRVIIASCDFFQNKGTGKTYARIKYTTLMPQIASAYNKFSEIKEYSNLANSELDKDVNFDDVILDFIEMTDFLPKNDMAETLLDQSSDQRLDISNNDTLTDYVFVLNGYSNKDVKNIKAILQKIAGIQSVQVIENNDKVQKILLTCTFATEKNLAESLYENGLSYNINNNERNLVRLMSGV